MNKTQKIILIIFILLLIAIFLYPPCSVKCVIFNDKDSGKKISSYELNLYFLEYKSIFSITSSDGEIENSIQLSTKPKIFISLLFAEILILTLIAGSLLLFFNNFKFKVEKKKKKLKKEKHKKETIIKKTNREKNLKILKEDKKNFLNEFRKDYKDYSLFGDIKSLYGKIKTLIKRNKYIEIEEINLFNELQSKKNILRKNIEKRSSPDVLYL